MKPRVVGIQIICSTKLNRDDLSDCVDDFIKTIDESNCTDMTFVSYMSKKDVERNIKETIDAINNPTTVEKGKQ